MTFPASGVDLASVLLGEGDGVFGGALVVFWDVAGGVAFFAGAEDEHPANPNAQVAATSRVRTLIAWELRL